MNDFFDVLSPLDKAKLLRAKIEKLDWYVDIYAKNRAVKSEYEADVIAGLTSEIRARCEELLTSIENEQPLND